MVSVVMIACAAGVPSLESVATSSGMPRLKGARSRGCPMTPVDATATLLAGMPRASPTKAQVASASSFPPAQQVLAMPLLQMTALIFPASTCAFVTARGAPLTRLRVYTAAAFAGADV